MSTGQASRPLAALTSGALMGALGGLIATLHKVIAVLLAAIAAVLLFSHYVNGPAIAAIDRWRLWIAGATAGLIIGIVASLLGVAGGSC